MFKLDLSQPMPRGEKVQDILKVLAMATEDPQLAQDLRQGVLHPQEGDEYLPALIFVLMVAMDDRRQSPIDLSIKKMVCLAGLGDAEVCDQVKRFLTPEKPWHRPATKGRIGQ
jgi:hypothetical protein